MKPQAPSFESERKRFPITRRFAYLDHASRGPISPPAYDLIRKRVEEMCHLHPNQLKEMNNEFQQARQGIADLIGAPRSSVAFVPNTSSGIAMVAGSLPANEGDNVVCSEGEFPSNVFPWLNLERRGVKIRMLKRPPTGITVDQVRHAVDARTRAVALSWVGFSDGARIDLEGMTALCAEKKIVFAVDAIQGVGALEVDLAGIDFLICGSGKWTLAPQGGGFVYIRPSRIEGLCPDRVGWLSMASNADLKDLTALTSYRFELAKDARRVETGSNSPLTQLALGASCSYLHGLGREALEARIFSLCDYLMEGLQRKGITPSLPVREGLRSGIVCFPAADPSDLAARLVAEDVLVSTREGRIRVGIHFYNNEEDLDRLLDLL